MVVKPERHVTAVADLTDAEAGELGPLLRDTSAIVCSITSAEQVYNCLWSHAGGEPVHIHYVVQPVAAALMADYGVYGPELQMAMFIAGALPDVAEVERFCDAARSQFSERRSKG